MSLPTGIYGLRVPGDLAFILGSQWGTATSICINLPVDEPTLGITELLSLLALSIHQSLVHPSI